MNPLYPDVALRAGHRCEYCRAPEAVFNFPFEVEHITPSAHAGSDEDTNLALACRACNLRKAASLTCIDPETEQVLLLFHPRQDNWDEHFQIDPESGEIRGLTPLGRGTIVRLAMNSPLQLTARRQWMRLGLFP